MSRSERIVARLLVLAIAVGCLALWLVVPELTLLALSQVVHSTSTFLLASLALMPVTMAGFAWLLSIANRRYLAVSGALRQFEEEAEPDEDPRRLYGPLESMLPTSIVLAIIAFGLWFAFVAE